jgi:hypothetical protein
MEHPGKGKREAPSALVKGRGAGDIGEFQREKALQHCAGEPRASWARAEARALI